LDAQKRTKVEHVVRYAISGLKTLVQAEGYVILDRLQGVSILGVEDFAVGDRKAIFELATPALGGTCREFHVDACIELSQKPGM
jgi:hypothetical protein